jgi:hypothetical protein
MESKMNTQKSSRGYIFYILVLAEILIPTSVNATAIMNVIYDSFDLHAYTIWGDNSYVPRPLDKPYGTIEEDRMLGKVFLDGYNTYGVGSGTNMAYANATVYSDVREERAVVEILTNLDDDIPGSRAGYGYTRAAWNLIFNVDGNGGRLLGGGSAGIWWDYIDTKLYDTSTGTLYEGIFDVSLIDGHTYSLFTESVQRVMGGDEAFGTLFEFSNMHIDVPEPSALFLFCSALASLGFSRTRKAESRKPASEPLLSHKLATIYEIPNFQ